MKFLYYLIVPLLLGVPFFSFTQFEMQDVSWKSLPSPGGLSENISGDLSSIEITDNGDIYFVFFDDASFTLFVNKFDVISNSWIEIYQEVIPGITAYQIDTYSVGNNIYTVLLNQGFPETIYTWKMDDSEVVTTLFSNQSTSLSSNLGFDFFVDESNEKMYFACRDMNSSLIVDKFDLATTSLEASSNVGVQCFSVPQFSYDFNASMLYVVFEDGLFELKAFESDLSTPLAFNPVNSNGEIFSNTVGGGTEALDGINFKMNEKANSQPTIVFNQDQANPSTHRTTILSSLYTDTEIEPVPGLSDFAVSGSGDQDYILAYIPNDNSMKVIELLPNGSMDFVSINDDPVIEALASPGEALAISKAPFVDRIGAFYHLPGADGQPGGNFILTNQAPSISDVGSGLGCTGQLGTVWEGIKFDDLDGDQVVITNTFLSSNNTVIDPSSIVANQSPSGHWSISADPLTSGVTDIIYEYTDGLDTLTANVTVNVVDPVLANFESSVLGFCSNDSIVNFNQFVDETGGFFDVDGITTENGSFNLQDLNISAYPYTSSIIYNYEDVNGCETQTNAAISVYESPYAEVSVVSATDCSNSTGILEAIVNSPNGSYDSYWNTGDQNTLVASDLASGTYYFNVMDEVGCIYVAQEDIDASDLTINGNVTDPTCFDGSDGSIDIDVIGGNGNHSVLWSTGHSNSLLTDLSAGNYQVWVTGDNGCLVSKTFNLVNPPEFTVDYQEQSPTCGQSDGALELTSSNNGAPPYSFEWNNGATTQDLSGINPDYYEVTVTDAQNCKAEKSFNVNFDGAPVASLDRIRNSTCGLSNGKIDVSISPITGEEISSIVWSNGASTEDISGLVPDAYECVISQSNGCDAIYEWEVGTSNLAKPEICIVSVDTTTNTNLIVWEKEINNPHDIEYYKIYRETAEAHNYKLIDTVHHSNISVFNDVVASPANRSWRYRISAVNSCGVESAPSRSHKTIHLVTNEDGSDVTVTWDNYEGFTYNNYSLLRYTDDFGWEVLDPNIPFASIPSYVDTPPSFNGLDYMIEVNPPSGLCTATFGKAQDYNSSRSNKPTSAFIPGDGTGDPNNSTDSFENEAFSVTVYPNPSEGTFVIDLNHIYSNANLNMEVSDLNGKVIQNGAIQNGINEIQLEDIRVGMYFIKLYDESTSETIRIVIQ